ncbi:MAG: DUF488 family protein [Bifidobacterium sp.]|nr:DUF488 family protein [Bifidobacterium sp.]
MNEIRIKRAYEEPSEDDGYRVLVDRLWPRGRAKTWEHLDLWLKDIAPSTELRKSWDHDPDTILEFAERYRRELDANPQAVAQLEDIVESHPVTTLVYAAKDPDANNARLLRDYLVERLASR